MPTPMMHVHTARRAGCPSGTPDDRDENHVVMTSATAPSGCTTISGANVMLMSWRTTAMPSMSVPSTQ